MAGIMDDASLKLTSVGTNALASIGFYSEI